MGQTVRGGRSGPPEMKLGAAAAKGGKETEFSALGGTTTGTLLTIAVAEQHPVHRPHESAPELALLWSAVVSALASWSDELS
ncbi:MAG: hypothetical protein JWP60_2077 [Ramlibacter sp.]|nr:hypothetical protein [Ramlibacter sp.]